MEKIKIDLPIIVEGKYDKNTLLQILDATVLTTGGFAVFNSIEKRRLLQKLSENGVIILTDSDGGGIQIRKFLSGILPKEKVYNLYIPRIEGKEKRKNKPSKSGTLGVEGMDRSVIESLFKPFAKVEISGLKNGKNEKKMLTKLDFFEHGLSGGANSSSLRDRLAERFSLPPQMTANALLEALNILTDYDGFLGAIEEISKDEI